MGEERNSDFYKLTFSQREDKAPLPEQMQLGHIPQKFRRLVWKHFHNEIVDNTSSHGNYYTIHKSEEEFAVFDEDFERLEILAMQDSGCDIEDIIFDYKFDILEIPHDKISCTPSKDTEYFREKILEGEYQDVLTLVEYIIRHEKCRENLRNSLIDSFEKSSAGYSVVQFDKLTIIPTSSLESSQLTPQSTETTPKASMNDEEVHPPEIVEPKKYGEKMKGKVFIGHGHSLVWLELEKFITDRLKLQVVEFNSASVAGSTNIDRLKQMLNEASVALLVMTAEDKQPDGRSRARENVVHEAGLFQGRLGFEKAVIVLEEGCEKFSNVDGLVYIEFPQGKIKGAFEYIREFFEREGLL